MDWLILLAVIIVAYLIGSIPTGYIIVKKLKGIDIRTVGSGSTGATNVKRVLGTKFFIVVLLLDALKGALPILMLNYYNSVSSAIPNIHIFNIIAGIMLVIGHSKSVFINFTGGKSVATSVGVLFGLCWQVALVAFAIWFIIVYFTKFVSLGSIVSSMATPVLMWLFDQPSSYAVFTLLCACYLSLYLHRENIKRLWSGTESKISF